MTMRGNTILVAFAIIGGVVLIHSPIAAEDIGNAFLLVMTSLAWLFVIAYTSFSTWRDTPAGKSILYANMSFALLGTQVSLSTFWGLNYPGRDIIRPYLYLALAISMLNMFLTLVRYQREDRARRKELDASPPES